MNDQQVSPAVPSGQPESGGVLGYEEFLKRLDRGEVFKPGTWAASSLRPAAYDLRIASDFMIVAGSDGAEPVVFAEGVVRHDTLVLKPGQLALVSTAENLRMPWDLAAVIGVKSSLSRRGLLVLGGGFVDPGFGLGGHEERLHFRLINIGGFDVDLRPGSEKIASLQVYPVVGGIPPSIRNIPVRGMQDARQTHFEESPGRKPGRDLVVGFFTELSTLRTEVKRIDNDLKALGDKVSEVRSGAVPLMTFGVAVLGVTFLGVVFSSLMNIAADPALLSKLEALRNAAGGQFGLLGLGFFACGLGFVCGWGVQFVAGLAHKLARKLPLQGTQGS